MENPKYIHVGIHQSSKPSKAFNLKSSTHRDYISPKIIKRKPQIKGKENLKTKKEMESQFCYISPKKDIQSLITKYKEDNVSSVCGSPRSSLFYEHSIGSNIFKRCDSVKENPIKSVIKCQNVEMLKNDNRELSKKIKEYEDKILRLEEQNQYCFSKIEEFNILIAQKEKQILQKQKIEERNSYLQKKYEQSEQQILNLSDIILNLNKKSSLSVETDDSYGYDYETQIEEYKRVNNELAQKIKYLLIQEAMYKKLRTQNEELMKKHDKLKFMNQKMLTRLSQLTYQNRNNKKSRVLFVESQSQTESDASISFSLSPGK